MEEKQKIGSKTWFVVLMLFIFFPVGLYFMWKNNKFNKGVRIIITILFGLALIGNMGDNSTSSTDDEIKDTYTESTNKNPAKAEVKEDETDVADEPVQTPEKVVEPPKEKLELLNLDSVSDEYLSYAVGTVRNNTNRTYSYVQISINELDANGSVVGSTLANMNNLQPGQDWAFKAMLYSDEGVRFEVTDITGW